MLSISRIYACLILAAVSVIPKTIAQTEHIFKQPAHTFPQTLSWWDSIYMYPEFRNGRITFFTDFSPDEIFPVNYNLYYGDMQMITSQGDTVAIDPPKTIKYIQVGDDVFYVDRKKGYLRILLKGDLTLAVHTLMVLVKSNYVSGNINRAEAIDVRGRPTVYDNYYKINSWYYFMDEDGRTHLPSKAVVLKLFPEYKDAITTYLQTRTVDFMQGKDLVAVAQFCNNLRRIPAQWGHHMIVPAHQRASVTLYDSIYRFSSFQEAVAIFKNGKQRHYAALNYNLMTGEMYSAEKSDTVKIRDSGAVATINIDGTNYFKTLEGYVELLLSGPVSLGVVRSIEMIHSTKQEASAKQTPASTYDPGDAGNDVVNFDRLFAKQNKYFLLDGRGQSYPVTTSSLYRMYPEQKKDIDQYLASHKDVLGNENGLKDLITYLAGSATKK